jgi:hypothetical protein
MSFLRDRAFRFRISVIASNSLSGRPLHITSLLSAFSLRVLSVEASHDVKSFGRDADVEPGV